MDSFQLRPRVWQVITAAMLVPAPVLAEQLGEVVTVLQVVPYSTESPSTERTANYEVRRRTIAELLRIFLRSEHTLKNKPVEDSELLRSQAAPGPWLARAARVATPSRTQLITVKLAVEHRERDQGVAFLGKLVELFMGEFRDVFYEDDLLELAHLKRQNSEWFKELKRVTEERSRLVKQLGSTDIRAHSAEQTMRISQLNSVQRLHDRLSRQYKLAVSELTLIKAESLLGQRLASALEDELKKDPKYYELVSATDQARDQIERLSNYVQPSSNQLQEVRQELNMLQQKREELREQLTPLALARLLEETEGKNGSNPTTKHNMDQQEQVVRNIGLRMKEAANDYEEKLRRVEELGNKSGHLDAVTEDIAALRRDMSQSRERLLDLELKLEGRQSIRIVQEAVWLSSADGE